MSPLMAVKVQKSRQDAFSLRAAEPVRRMNRDFQIRFTAILLALLTTAAVVYAGYNLSAERQFQVPDDGVWWVEHQAKLTADRVDAGGPGVHHRDQRDDHGLQQVSGQRRLHAARGGECPEQRAQPADQAVPAFDQPEYAFALSHAARSADQSPDPHDIDHASMLGGGWGKIHFQTNRRSVDKPHRHHRGAKDGDFELSRGIREGLGNSEMAGNDDAGDMLLAKLQTAGLLLGFRQALQIASLGIAKDLNTFSRKIGKKSGKRQPRTINGWFADFSLEAEGRTNQFELKCIRVSGIEFADRNKR